MNKEVISLKRTAYQKLSDREVISLKRTAYQKLSEQISDLEDELITAQNELGKDGITNTAKRTIQRAVAAIEADIERLTTEQGII